MINLTDQVVAVTGAGRGIGAAIAHRFAEQGATVVGLDLGTPENAPEGVQMLQCDVSDAQQAQHAVSQIVDLHGRLDVLINNAGINVIGQVDELDVEQWDQAFAVNTRGVFNTCRAAIAPMKEQRYGRIINAASFAAVVPSVGSAAYAASKAAVVQMSRVLASELGPWNITVNSYAPGMIPGAMNTFSQMSPEAQEETLDSLSLRRWGQPEEVADVVCFLASDLARYTTGTMLDVSGGKLATQRPQDAYRGMEG